MSMTHFQRAKVSTILMRERAKLSERQDKLEEKIAILENDKRAITAALDEINNREHFILPEFKEVEYPK